MNIEDWRAEIDKVDDKLLCLLNRRARLAAKVGSLKMASRLPIADPEREHIVLRRACQANAGPLDNRAVVRLFHSIIRESRRIARRAAKLGNARAQKELP